MWQKLRNLRIIFIMLRSPFCVYYKKCLSFKVPDNRLLGEFIASDLKIGNQLWTSNGFYRSPGQSQDGFAILSGNFELTLDSF